MGTYTDAELIKINVGQKAKFGVQYVSVSGYVYEGLNSGALKLISDNFVPRAQKAVGGILENTTSSDLNYDPSVPEITSNLTDTGVLGGSYGNNITVPQITVDDQGRVANVVDVPIAFPVFPPSNVLVDYIATVNIAQFIVVTANGTVGDSAITGQKNKIIGISMAAVLAGFAGQVVGVGQIQNAAWAWTIGDKIFLNGTTLSTTAPATGFIQIIGIATASDTIDVKLGQSVLL